MRKIIKKIIPHSIKKRLSDFKLRRSIRRQYLYDYSNYIEYSNCFVRNDNSQKLLATIVRLYHVVEKGLTMPDMRMGFGADNIKRLVNCCCLYNQNGYDITNSQFIQCLSVLQEYIEVHKQANFELDQKLQEVINKALSLVGRDLILNSDQIDMSREEYFFSNDKAFDFFSNSRHSLRSFSGEVSMTQIENAVKLAQNAPSACNRQPSRVYVINDKDKIKEVLNLQHGNRGFGHLADKLIVLAAELEGYVALETNAVYVDGGIYAMNLLYALHFYKVGVCTLNWFANSDEDKKLREVINLPNSQRVIVILACGNVPEKFKIALSKRNEYKTIYKII